MCVLMLVALSYAFKSRPSRFGSRSTTQSSRLRASDLESISSAFTNLLSPSRKTPVIAVEELKEKICSLAKGTSNGIKASDEIRSEINKAVTQLEKASKPSGKLTSSPLLDGSWRLIYTENDGSSAGKLGPFVGEVIQDVDLAAENYVNYVRLPLLEGALTATWDELPKNKWLVKFQSIKFSVFGIKVKEQPLTAVGTWRFTYVDQDLRVLYASGGKNTVKENLFVLEKAN